MSKTTEIDIEQLSARDIHEIQYLENLFNSTPPIPADYLDVSELLENPSDGGESAPGYAWERLTSWLADVRQAREAGTGPIFIVDACSSTPLLAQRMRAGEFSTCRTRARTIIHDVYLQKDAAIEQLKIENPALLPIAKAVAASKDGFPLLNSAIQRVIYELSIDEWEDIDTLKAAVYAKLSAQRDVYIQEKKRSDSDIEAGWKIRFSAQNCEQSYLELVSTLLIPSENSDAARKALWRDEDYVDLIHAANRKKGDIGEDAREALMYDDLYRWLSELAKDNSAVGIDLAEQFISWQADLLGEAIFKDQKCRPVRFLSIDMQDQSEIARSSLTNTPPDTREMHLFPHALRSLFDSKLHLRHDMREQIPLPDNSINLLTLYDGWPFHAEITDKSPEGISQFIEETVSILEGFYRKLAFGGQLVIFPWELKNGGASEVVIFNSIWFEFSKRIKQGVGLNGFHRELLQDWMSPGDEAISESQSSIFSLESEGSMALMVTKQRESMVNRYFPELVQKLGWLATSRRIRDLLGPRL